MKLSVFFTGCDQNLSFLQGVLILEFGKKKKTKKNLPHPFNTSQARFPFYSS